MEPGRHQLTLQCISRTSGTVIDTLELTIMIAQPWWNAWWMWCIYVCLILLAFYGAWRVYELQEKYMRLSIDYLQMREARPQTESPKEIKDVPNNSQIQALEPEEVPSYNEKSDGEMVKLFVDKATKLIVENLGNSAFTIDRLCREMAMSRTLFYVKLKTYTGKSPQDFIRVIRLERAAALLRNGRSVTDAAALTGFDNPKYFSTVFKKYFGVSPSKYQ
jgi:AraC-like DNA-binding protein